MPDDKSKQFNPSSIRVLFLSCFVALLFLEVALALVAVRYHKIQNDILKDQARLLRARELLNDAVGDSKRIWNPTLDGSVATQQEPPSLPASATQATKATALLQKLARPSLAFTRGDVDRLDDTLLNNSKLLSAPPP